MRKSKKAFFIDTAAANTISLTFYLVSSIYLSSKRPELLPHFLVPIGLAILVGTFAAIDIHNYKKKVIAMGGR